MNDFGYALQAIKAGLRVRRESWQDGSFLRGKSPDKNEMTLPYIYKASPDGHTVPWQPRQEDMFAMDWDIITAAQRRATKQSL